MITKNSFGHLPMFSKTMRVFQIFLSSHRKQVSVMAPLQFVHDELFQNVCTYLRRNLDLICDGSNIIFRTSDKLERVHSSMIELEHLNFAFEPTNIEHRT